MKINPLVRWSLENRLLVIASCLLLTALGLQSVFTLPVDIFPELTRPTVTILSEAHGLAPEEVETLVTLPIETALSGTPDVLRVRSSSGVGLSLVFAEFDWDTDPYLARQLVQERLNQVDLPREVESTMGPLNSLLGEIMLVGVTNPDSSMTPLELRSWAEFDAGRRIQTLPGVSQVLAIGGGLRQLQVLPDPARMSALGITLDEVAQAAGLSQGNTGGGFLEDPGTEYLIRNLGRSAKVEDLASSVIRVIDGVPIRLSDIAEVRIGAAPKRGDAEVNGVMGVILGIQKQPGSDTVRLSREVEAMLETIRQTAPHGIKVDVLFRQASFIEHAIANVKEAILLGGAMVALVLFFFLLNLRTTLITLAAIPMSFVITLLCFRLFDVGINTMTLGGLAVAIGMVVDDAIVDMENVFRRLKQRKQEPVLTVIAEASTEIRSSIFIATAVIILVFLPLMGLDGVEGRLFHPVALATILSMAASFLVALTLIPVLCSWLLPAITQKQDKDSPVTQAVHRMTQFVLKPVLKRPRFALFLTGIFAAGCMALYPLMGKEFLPAFNEGSAIVSVISAPGTSLEQSNRIGRIASRHLLQIPEIASVGRRVGRAEQDEHAEGVFFNEMDVEFHKDGRPREEVLTQIRQDLGEIPGVSLNIGQPISHRLDHMLTGVEAQLVIKVMGDDLEIMRRVSRDIKALAEQVPGIVDLQIEQQVPIPQIRIEIDRDRARLYGIPVKALNEQLEMALGGMVVGEVLEDQVSTEIVIRYPERERSRIEALRHTLVSTPGGSVPLELLADIRRADGPNTINREQVRRRMVVSANTSGRDLGTVVEELKALMDAELDLPAGMFLKWEGQFQNQQRASRRIMLLSLGALLCMAALLHSQFRSVSLVLQVLLSVPLAFAGGILLAWLKLGTVSVALLVGLITLTGIATRNTIMLISHYRHMVEHEGWRPGKELVIQGTAERMVPVLMTALTAGLALLPLFLAGNEPGKEILHPVAVVILGGLVSSTLLTALVTPAVYYLFSRE
jgi:CzcA family heavy metal efflux pump